MSPEQRLQRINESAAEFEQHENRQDGLRLATSLADGLNVLRDSLYTRIHEDVELTFGMDSMLMPVSLVKSETMTKQEIDVYAVVESAAFAEDRQYVSTTDGWYGNWLARLRLGDSAAASGVTQRLSYYASKTADERRRVFAVMLERAMPEAGRAPLIMYRLFPLAVEIVTALAFGDHLQADELRHKQMQLLPGIVECRECRGSLLDNGEKCPQCGNPIWKFDWLTAE